MQFFLLFFGREFIRNFCMLSTNNESALHDVNSFLDNWFICLFFIFLFNSWLLSQGPYLSICIGWILFVWEFSTWSTKKSRIHLRNQIKYKFKFEFWIIGYWIFFFLQNIFFYFMNQIKTKKIFSLLSVILFIVSHL